MSQVRTQRRIVGSLSTAAAAFGVSTVAIPTAAAQDVTIDLNAVAAAIQAAEASSQASQGSSGTDVRSLANTASALSSAVEIATTQPSTASTTATAPSASAAENAAAAEAEHEASALNLANALHPERGQTSDGRTVVFPTKGEFTSGFGPRWGTVHEGIDIANDVGTPIKAAMDGTVVNSGPASGFGQWVVLKHDNGEKTVYGHISESYVSPGQRVEAGETIAAMGNEGHSTGPHLHFEIRPDGNTAVDPVAWFADQGIAMNLARL
ncbi:M23 family metallopeptidase [Corynebacterium tapiri]|uniref:M23 family metallopeptidase n=1 Tax=Corynebacterium tapiri TaxID=1448266 RepID=A0A5C4U7G4_9CORY|nr:M23 family metallopeptidase [Corynebacterium tapiri]TNM00413.1 M23 family metallopeptidase [Corynebacterium tapiri]